MPKLLWAKGLTKTYQGSGTVKNAVSEVNLIIPENSVVGLIGESGGGKTTLCRLILGLEEPDNGMVQLRGRVLPHLRRRSFADCAAIQYVFQDPYAALEEEITVSSTLAEPVRLCKRNRREPMDPREALALVGLSEFFLARRVKTLSGGQRQKVNIARALVTRPELVIGDECTSMLDAKTAAEIAGIFSRLAAEQGVSFLLVTHDVHLIRGLCGYIYVMNEGRMVEEGPVDRVLETPVASYTREYVESVRVIEGSV